MVTMVTKKRYLINFTFFETVMNEPIPHKNFMLLGQESHEIHWGSGRHPLPPSLVSDVDTNILGNRRVKKCFLYFGKYGDLPQGGEQSTKFWIGF